MKRLIFFTAFVLIVGLLAGAASQAAKAPEIFKLSQGPISKVKVVREAGQFAKKLNGKEGTDRNYTSYASRKTSNFVGRLNDLGKQRRQARNEYLSDKLTAFEQQLAGPIEARYRAGLAAIERSYRAEIRTINSSKGSRSKKAALRAQAAAKRKAAEAALAQQRAAEYARALRRVNESRRASKEVLAKVTAQEKLAIKRDKVRLRKALAHLRSLG